jgi:hypothetical protein
MFIHNGEGKTIFTCNQEEDGMFYLKGRHLKTAGIFKVEETEWQNPAPETVDTEGKTKAATQKCVIPKKMEINKAHYNWGHMS